MNWGDNGGDMNSKQIYKKPTCFKDMLELQEALDNKLKSNNRTEQQILLSMVAEVIEFNEELECSHKTWKTKKHYSLEKQKEELVDVIFFFLQLINHKKKENDNYEPYSIIRIFDTLNNDRTHSSINHNESALELISNIAKGSYYFIAYHIIAFINYFEISQAELYDLYFTKWQINMDRVDKKVEEGGWS